MRFSTLLATAAIITPAVLAASSGNIGTALRGSKRDSYGLLGAQDMHRPRDLELGHLQVRNDKLFAEELPGYTDDKDDGTREPASDSSTKAQEKSDGSDTSDMDKEPTQTESGGDDLEPSAYNGGEEASFPPGRGYIRSRALNARQDDGDDDDEHDDVRYACEQGEDGECGNDDNEGPSEEPDSDNARYLAKIKRAREEHLKSINAKRNAATGYKLKQASRRDVVERSRHARRTGSRPSASPRPAR